DTHIWLNTGTALDVRYDDTRRLIALKAGEILIDTGKDARRRPFHVATRYGDLQALGTRFSVRDDADGTLLAVFGGAVRIRTAAGAEAIVPANRQQRFDAQRIDAPAPADLAREAWSRGVLIADDMTLAAFAAELGRYRHGYLRVSPEVASLRVVGRYPLDRPAQILAMVSQDLPIAVRHPLPWWTTIGPR
ncbi:FecR domain-containing protein, partial [Burkholderia sp. Ac-20379]|uniref:FecR domain-containing protein n=1 Tax=Burkholderia sp. Ac-20379 TaxID=2703900 RepID=UPI00198133A6